VTEARFKRDEMANARGHVGLREVLDDMWIESRRVLVAADADARKLLEHPFVSDAKRKRAGVSKSVRCPPFWSKRCQYSHFKTSVQ
jgi:hypothetical protein